MHFTIKRLTINYNSTKREAENCSNTKAVYYINNVHSYIQIRTCGTYTHTHEYAHTCI